MTKSSAAKQRTRRQQLNELATAKGWGSWSEFETAAINDKIDIPEKDITMDTAIVTKRIDSRNSDMVLRAGAKGRGKELFKVSYWPDSPRSVEQAEQYMIDFASRNGYNIVSDAD